MKVLALIPARGGSKGIPRKNVRLLGGQPLLAHTIAQAHATPAIDRVVVSTDDDEIAAVAQGSGAAVVRRPDALSGDEASSESALLHALDHLHAAEGYEPDLVVFLQATSPLRRPGDIRGAIETFIREDADSLFSACPVHGFVWRVEGVSVRPFSYDHRARPRRQDAPEDLVENGSIYIFKPDVLRQTGNRLGGKIAVYRMHPLDSFQIDEQADLELFEALMAVRPSAPAAGLLADVRLLVLDFDGVLTDNRVLVDQHGTEAVFCHRGDGWGLARLQEAGVEVCVLSTEQNPVVAARCRKLRVSCQQACDDKRTALAALAAERGLAPEQIAFVGNDHNDLEGLRWVGVPMAVADAEPAVRAAAKLVTNRPGGYGAVREICDWLVAAQAVPQPSST